MCFKRFGIVHIGLNSVKLFIADVVDIDGKIMLKKYVHTRMPIQLGKDIFSTASIPNGKLKKLIQIITTYKSFIDITECVGYKICASYSICEAKNIKEVIDYIFHNTNIKIELITPEQEAKYLITGNNENFEDSSTMYVIVNVGGGNTEIILYKDKKQIDYNTFNLGTVRKLDKSEERVEWNKVKGWLIDERKSQRHVKFIGTGGNINKINTIFRRNGFISRTNFSSYYKRIANMSMDAILKNTKLSINRAEVIVPAMGIYLEIMKILKTNNIYIPMLGIADGIIKELYYESKSESLKTKIS